MLKRGAIAFGTNEADLRFAAALRYRSTNPIIPYSTQTQYTD
jgi:hypothetical protein